MPQFRRLPALPHIGLGGYMYPYTGIIQTMLHDIKFYGNFRLGGDFKGLRVCRLYPVDFLGCGGGDLCAISLDAAIMAWATSYSLFIFGGVAPSELSTQGNSCQTVFATVGGLIATSTLDRKTV